MDILIFGAGTIGVTCACLLSHSATVYMAEKHGESGQLPDEVRIKITDLRKCGVNRTLNYRPVFINEVKRQWDLILVAVNRLQLKDVLPRLKQHAGKAEILFLMNHWCLREEVEAYLTPGQYVIGFPSFVGGGRQGCELAVNLYEEAVPLGLPGKEKRLLPGQDEKRLLQVGRIFTEAGLRWRYQADMESWLKIHYLQQSISAGAILKAGSYEAFACDRKAIQDMARAMREGVKLCEACGALARDPMVRAVVRLPLWLVGVLMKKMFQSQTTAVMVKGHMKKGLPEWAAGYWEVLETAKARGVAMPVWSSYLPYVADMGQTI